MSAKNSIGNQPATEEFITRVLKRGLELRNWSAAAKEFRLPTTTVRTWRNKHSGILERLAFELGVRVYCNPQLELEYQTDKFRTMPLTHSTRESRHNKMLSTRTLTCLEAAALILKKAKSPMTTQRIYQDILLFQLRNRINFDELKSDLLSHCGSEDPFSLMKSTPSFFNENIYAFRLKQNSVTKKLVTSALSCLREDVKPSFTSHTPHTSIKTARCSEQQQQQTPPPQPQDPPSQPQPLEQHSHSNSQGGAASLSSKGIHLLVPNLCVKPISVAGSSQCTSPSPVSPNCHQIYIRENVFQKVSPALCKEIAPSPVRSLLASDKRWGRTRHRGITGEEIRHADDLTMQEDLPQTALRDSTFNQMSIPATSSVVIERQSDSLNLSNIPSILLAPNETTGQLYHVITHSDQMVSDHSEVQCCDERGENAAVIDSGDSSLSLTPKDSTSRHLACDPIKREAQRKPVAKSKKKKNGVTSPVSNFLVGKDIKTLINRSNFRLYFSEEEKNELVSLMPNVDQILSPSEVRLSDTAFSHEYFSQALTEWHEDVLCGDVSLNVKPKIEKTDYLRKSDLWKVKQLQDYESCASNVSSSIPPGGRKSEELRAEIDQEKRNLSKSFEDSTLRDLFLHPSVMYSCLRQLERTGRRPTEVRVPLSESLKPVWQAPPTHPPTHSAQFIDLTLSDSDDSSQQAEDILFNKSSLVISLPRISSDIVRETPKKSKQLKNSNGCLHTDPGPSKKLKTAHKMKV